MKRTVYETLTCAVVNKKLILTNITFSLSN